MDWIDDHNPEWQARLRREREQRKPKARAMTCERCHGEAM